MAWSLRQVCEFDFLLGLATLFWKLSLSTCHLFFQNPHLLFFFFCGSRVFELRASHLQVIFHLSHAPSSFNFSLFFILESYDNFAWDFLEPWSFCICLLSDWDYSCAIAHLAPALFNSLQYLDFVYGMSYIFCISLFCSWLHYCFLFHFLSLHLLIFALYLF